MNRASLVTPLLALGLSLGVATAHAAPPPVPASSASSSGDEKAAAEALYVEAQRLIGQGKFVEACPKLEDSQRRDPGIGTMLYLADCYEKVGRVASAWAEFREAEDLSHKENDQRAEVAKRHADALEPRLARLTIKVSPASDVQGMIIRRDGKALGPSERGVAIPVDPGPHVVTVEAPKKKPWKRPITIAETPTNTDLEISGLEDAPEPPPPPKATIIQEEPTKGNTQRVVGLATTGAGVAGVTIGIITGLGAKSTYDDSASHCTGNFCDATGTQKRHAAYDSATVSTISWIAGGALLAGGGVLYFTAPRAKVVTVGVSPLPGGVRVGLGGEF